MTMQLGSKITGMGIYRCVI